MANVFCDNGHLQEQALLLLLHDGPLDDLERLEIAEHLSYCDHCLQRYTQLLSSIEPAIPCHSCQDTLWTKIHRKTAHLLTRRYAAAAAAVALALTLLWGSAHPDFIKVKEAFTNPHTPYTQFLQSHWEGTTEQTASWLSGLMDHLDPLQERITP